MTPPRGTLHLIPWCMGDNRDLPLSSAAAVRRLRVFFAEHPDVSRKQFEPILGPAVAEKTIFQLPARRDEAFLARALALLDEQDVGLVSDGGIPCFVDPGAWLVAELRARGAAIKAIPGASALTTMLALSGVEWRDEPDIAFSFTYFIDHASHRKFSEVAARDEALFVLLNLNDFRRCVEVLERIVGERPVTAFFDLSKTPASMYPYADRVVTRTCREWLEGPPPVDWSRVSDVCLMVSRGTGA